MGAPSVQYWQATDYVLELAQDLVVVGEHVSTEHVARLLDFEPMFLNRVVTNIGVGQLLFLAHAAPIDFSSIQVLNVVLMPIYPLPAVELEQVAWPEEFGLQVWRALTHSHKTADDLRTPLFIETQATNPTAAVVNSAMPVIYSFLLKGVALQRVPGPMHPGDKGDITRPYSRSSFVIAETKKHLRLWLSS
jgi:hypothetical protein